MTGRSDAVDGAAATEQRYRDLIRRWYPQQWRERHGEAMLGVLLDTADADGRSGPTSRERLDMLVRGSQVRLAAVLPGDVRGAAASISTGVGVGFACAYFGLFIGTRDPNWFLVEHLGPIVILVVWSLVLLAAALRHGQQAALVLTAAAVLPLPLLRLVPVDPMLLVTGWERPSDATIAFLVVSAGIGLLGRLDRRVVLRTTVVSLVVSGVVLWWSGDSGDPYDSVLWAPDHCCGLTGRMPLAPHADLGSEIARGLQHWTDAIASALSVLPATGVLIAFAAAVVLRLRHRTRTAAIVAICLLPAATALIVGLLHPSGVDFQ